MAYRLERQATARLTYRDSNDLPAVGYKVWSVLAGTSTLATTYQNKAGSANTNPIVLDAKGQCVVWVNVSVDLIFCLPTSTGVADGVIQTDPDFEYTDAVTYLATVTPGTLNNQYVATHDPVLTSLSDEVEIRLTPDTDSVNTLGTATFTGTGINDNVFSGPYTGSTTGSNFDVVIDHISFDDAGLNDLTWGGTPTLGALYSVEIDAVGATDTVTTRKDGVVVASAVAITGAAQALVDGVTFTFAAVTGHTLADRWNNVDSVKWRKDAGAWTEGVAITAEDQNTIEGIKFNFAVKTGHTLGDQWTQPVVTPVRLNFCSLYGTGAAPTIYPLVYKNVSGTLTALGEGDWKQNIPVSVIFSLSQTCYIMQGPALPVLETIQPLIIRREVIINTTLTEDDHRREIYCKGTLTLTLVGCSAVPNYDIYITTDGAGTVTVAVDGGTDLIFTSQYPSGTASLTLYPGPLASLRLHNNGVSWHILSETGAMSLVTYTTMTADSTKTISNLEPDINYRMIVRDIKATDGLYYIRFNADAGNNYFYQTHAAAAAAVTAAEASNQAQIIVSGVSVKNASGILMTIDFSTYLADDTITQLNAVCGGFAATDNYFTSSVYGRYSGAAALSSITLLVSAGTMTGDIHLYQLT